MNQTNQPKLPTNQKVAFIQAAWHDDIVGQGREAFISNMSQVGITSDNIDIFDVPGSLEIPLQAKMLAESGDYAVIVACGFVVDGGIYRHEFVASAVLDGMMRVQLDTGVPILSVVLTPKDTYVHESHHKFFFDHFTLKGQEAAHACIKTLENMSRFNVLDKAAA